MPNSLVEYIWRMRWYVGALIAVLGISQAVFFWGFFSGHYELGSIIAWGIAWGGTVLVFAVMVTWIVFIDSKKRWPGQTTFQRWTNFVTFRR